MIGIFPLGTSRRRSPRLAAAQATCGANLWRAASEAVRLEQPEPDLADGRERGHRVPQHVERHFAADRDGGPCSISPTPGPVNVAPTTTRRALSTTSWLVPVIPTPCTLAPETSPVP